MEKRGVKLFLAIIAVAGVILSIGYSSRKVATKGITKFEPTPARLERGRYIVEGLAHCFQCHSEIEWQQPGAQPKTGKKGGGTSFPEQGMEWLVAPNITPDVETGAGRWTDEQFARAIREGIGHDGRRLLPVMPYLSFRQMSDEDLASVIVYVRSLEPMRNPLPKTALPDPLKSSLPPHEPITSSVSPPDMSNPVARGKYLVMLGDCAGCHTPTRKGRPITELEFAGGMSFNGPYGQLTSANITPDPSGISYYDEKLFVEALRTGHVGARKLNSVMPWGYFRNLTDEDLKAIFAYLRTLPPVQHRIDNTEVPTACPVCGRKHGFGERNHKDSE